MASKTVRIGAARMNYDDSQTYPDLTTSESVAALHTDGQCIVKTAPTDDNHVIRKTDLDAISASIISRIAVSAINDPSTELNDEAGTAFGDIILAYQDDDPSQFNLYAWDPATDQTEAVPFSVDGSTGIWISLGPRYPISNIISTTSVVVQEDMIVNNTKGATGDLTVHGDTVDEILKCDASGDGVTVNGTLALAGTTTAIGTFQSYGPVTLNANKTANNDVTIHGDTVDDVLMVDASANSVTMAGTLGVAGATTINSGSGATGDLRVYADAYNNFVWADVSTGNFYLFGSGSTVLSLIGASDSMTINGDVRVNSDQSGYDFIVDGDGTSAILATNSSTNAVTMAGTLSVDGGLTVNPDGTDAEYTENNFKVYGGPDSSPTELIVTSAKNRSVTLSGIVGINGVLTVGANATFSGDLVIPTETPASAGASGTAGQIAWDASYIYICVATDTWKRVAISTW